MPAKDAKEWILVVKGSPGKRTQYYGPDTHMNLIKFAKANPFHRSVEWHIASIRPTNTHI